MLRRAFTLVELLMVLAIIILLVALLLPVFQQTRKKSHEPVCINNLKQFHVAFTLYREDYGDTARFQSLLLPYIRDRRILRCPLDTYKRGAAWWGSDRGDRGDRNQLRVLPSLYRPVFTATLPGRPQSRHSSVCVARQTPPQGTGTFSESRLCGQSVTSPDRWLCVCWQCAGALFQEQEGTG